MKEKIVYCPAGSEFSPCDPRELEPLVEHLRRDAAVVDQLVFPRGSHLPDGRLDLCKQCIGPQGAEVLAEALIENSHTKHLLLGANGLGDTGARAVAGAIRRSPTLETIYLGCNRIQEEGAAELLSALHDNERVTGLWLKRNPIGFAGARRVAELLRRNHTLRTLDLVHTKIGSEGVRLIAETMSEPDITVERLYLGGNQIGPNEAPAIAQMVRASRSLHSLFLSVNRIGDRGAEVLAEAIAGNDRLRVISLSCNDIGPVGGRALAAALRRHSTITWFDLGFDRSTPVLREQPNRLGDEGARAIAEMLESNRCLRSLDLLRNGITTSGAQAIVDALQGNTTLTELVIGKNIARRVKRRAGELLARNAAGQQPTPADDPQLQAIRSVYRGERRKA